MPRIGYPDINDPGMGAMLDLVRGERQGRLPNLFVMHMHNSAILRGWLGLGTALRYESSLDDRTRELTICYVARLLNCDYQWVAHAPIAVRSGVSELALDGFPTWEGVEEFDDRDRAVFRYVQELTESASVSDAAFAALRECFSEQQIMELTATAAFYGCAARFIKALQIRTDDILE